MVTIKILAILAVLIFVWIATITDRDNFYDRLEDEQAEDYLKRISSIDTEDKVR